MPKSFKKLYNRKQEKLFIIVVFVVTVQSGPRKQNIQLIAQNPYKCEINTNNEFHSSEL